MMTATLTSKLPTSPRPLFHDRDLSRGITRLLAHLNGPALTKAQNAVRTIAQSGAQGSFSALLELNASAIEKATGPVPPCSLSDEALDRLAPEKLPHGTRPLIMDVDMANAVEKLLAPYKDTKLERAQDAVRKVLSSGVQGTFEPMVAHFRSAISTAVKET
jgi:hypothetical protein